MRGDVAYCSLSNRVRVGTGVMMGEAVTEGNDTRLAVGVLVMVGTEVALGVTVGVGSGGIVDGRAVTSKAISIMAAMMPSRAPLALTNLATGPC